MEKTKKKKSKLKVHIYSNLKKKKKKNKMILERKKNGRGGIRKEDFHMVYKNRENKYFIYLKLH